MKHAIFGALALASLSSCAPAPAIAAEAPPSLCVNISVPKDAIAARNGRWIELTPEQWQFMRGIYVMNPATPAGLPYGDRAILAEVPGHAGGVVFFIDGDRACTPMPVPSEITAMLQDVATGTLNHEGRAL